MWLSLEMDLESTTGASHNCGSPSPCCCSSCCCCPSSCSSCSRCGCCAAGVWSALYCDPSISVARALCEATALCHSRAIAREGEGGEGRGGGGEDVEQEQREESRGAERATYRPMSRSDNRRLAMTTFLSWKPRPIPQGEQGRVG